jgi:hypothetical protein
MHKRFMQEDGLGVLWHDRAGKRATFWNFKDRSMKLPGKVRDLTAGKDLSRAKSYKVKACHTYAITGVKLPVAVP